jgi:hypothetical protein
MPEGFTSVARAATEAGDNGRAPLTTGRWALGEHA